MLSEDCCLRSKQQPQSKHPYRGNAAGLEHLAAHPYGFFTSGALKYFSIGISKYISSLPR
jgi:hypothetical protein